MAHIQERVSLLLSAYWFCHSHCFPSQSKLSHCAFLLSAQITHLINFGCQTVFIVTPFVFFQQDDRYFLSGSLDGKLRLWNIPDKKVALWNEVDGQTRLITAANFCQNGKYAVIGTYDGRCIFYDTEVLSHDLRIHFWHDSINYRLNGMFFSSFICKFFSVWNTTLKFMWDPPEAETKLDARSLALSLYLERIR